MIDLLEIICVLDLLIHNFTFGLLLLAIGMIIMCGALAVANAGRGAKVVKFVGLSAAIFFLLPGLVIIAISIKQIL